MCTRKGKGVGWKCHVLTEKGGGGGVAHWGGIEEEEKGVDIRGPKVTPWCGPAMTGNCRIKISEKIKVKRELQNCMVFLLPKQSVCGRVRCV